MDSHQGGLDQSLLIDHEPVFYGLLVGYYIGVHLNAASDSSSLVYPSFCRTDTTVPQLLSSAPPDLPDHEALDLILQQLKSRSNMITTPVNFLFLQFCFFLPLSLPGSITQYAIFKRSQTILPGIYVLAWFMLIYWM